MPHAVADGLRRHGVDATTSTQADLLGEDDPDQLAFAIADGRVLVTHDPDFTRIHAENPQHSGICYCHQDKYTIGELLRMLLLVSACIGEDEMRNHLEYL